MKTLSRHPGEEPRVFPASRDAAEQSQGRVLSPRRAPDGVARGTPQNKRFGDAVVPPPSQRLSLKTRWTILRARYSTAGLLARMDERKAVSLFASINGGLTILAIGFYSWLVDLPLVFPGLGPTAFVLFATPRTPSAAPRSVILGHFSGMSAGWVVWFLTRTVSGDPVSTETGGLAPVLSASLALAAACALLVRLSCPHVPACTSCLIVALGGVTDWLGVLLMAFAVVWVTAQAVAMNRLSGVPVPLWSPNAESDR